MLNVFKKIDFFLEERSFVSGVSLAHAMAAGICGTAADAQSHSKGAAEHAMQ